jgi:LPS export ABC transporter protein LptC
MIFRRFILIVSFILTVSLLYAADDGLSVDPSADEAVPPAAAVPAAGSPEAPSDQTISDFSLAGYGEKGKKTWDLAGKTADIFTDTVKLSDVVGNLYGKEENIRLTADEGDFNKVSGKVHLEDNVVITTSSGTRMFTKSLDWDRKNQQVTTDEVVCIKRDTMVATAKGAWGDPTLKSVSLKKNVRLDIIPAAKGSPVSGKDKIIITCDGPLEIDYAQNVAKFRDNVKVDREDSQIFSDTLDLYFLAGDPPKKDVAAAKDVSGVGGMMGMGSKIDKIVCRGHVKVIRGENISNSEEAVYSAVDNKLVLTGQPKLLIYSTKDFSNAPAGNKGPF